MVTQSFIVVTYDERAEIYRHQVFTEVAVSVPTFLRTHFNDEKTHFIHSLGHNPDGNYEYYFTFHIGSLGRIFIH